MHGDLATFGERLRQARQQRHQTQAVVAGLSGITTDYLYQIERGKTLPIVVQLARNSQNCMPQSTLNPNTASSANPTTKHRTCASHGPRSGQRVGQTCNTGPMSSSASVGPASRERARALLDSICDLYDEVFSAPPFRWADEESEHHRSMLSSLLVEPTFGIVMAETADGQLVGFAYGYSLPPNTRWWEGFQDPLSAEVTQERDGRTFALIDLAVQRKWRSQGIGRQLMDVLLGRRREERATLCVQPSATDAQAFYDRLGWQKIGRKDMPSGAVSPSFDVYLLELENRP